MKAHLNRIWQVELPADLVRQAGFQDGEGLECGALEGTVFLSAEGRGEGFRPAEKKIQGAAGTFLLWRV